MSKNYYDKNIISLHDFHFFERNRNFNIFKFHTMLFFLTTSTNGFQDVIPKLKYNDQENLDLKYKKVQ